MKAHSTHFKEEITKLGRQIDSVLAYTDELDEPISNDELFSITPVYEGGLLKSVMKELDIVSTNEFVPGEEVNYKFGVALPDYEQHLIEIGKIFYEDFYYPQVGKDFIINIANTKGYMMIDFNNLNKSIISSKPEYTQYCAELEEVCDGSLTKVKIIPKSPYNKTDYTIEATLVLKDGEQIQGISYEYIDFGNYTVYSSDYNADDKTYSVVAYDKMLNAMKDYDLDVTYPITIKDYLQAIATKMGTTLKTQTFVNSTKVLTKDVYDGLGYTYRDVLDELAQVTASTICISDDDQLEVRYINNTNDTIDEEFIKDVNVEMGEKYGPVNVLVLSRSADSDKIYYPQVLPENPIELKISDNQILNGNDRSEYMAGIFNQLQGLSYYTVDLSSTGICYYDLCDKYTIKINNKRYSCVMLNDEIKITQGLEENIYCDKPEESVSEYSHMSTTDKQIKQTNLIVDKQAGEISAVVSDLDPNNQEGKYYKLNARVEGLESEVGEITDVTITKDSNYGKVEFIEDEEGKAETINPSEPILVKIRPTTKNIDYLYPSQSLFPSGTLYPQVRLLTFTNIDTNEVFTYPIPNGLLYYNSQYYDEFTLDYENQICQIAKKCKYNEDGTVGLLTETQVIDYEYPTINLTEGKYKVELVGFANGYLKVRLMSKNLYTSQYATKVELKSAITQSASAINLSVTKQIEGVDKTIEDNYTTLNSKIDMTANDITSEVSKTYITKTDEGKDIQNLSSRIKQTATSISLTTQDKSTSCGLTIKLKNEDGSELDSKEANITMNGLVKFTDLSNAGSTTINGANITTGSISCDRLSGGTINGQTISGGSLNGTSINGGSINISKSYSTLATFTDTGNKVRTKIDGNTLRLEGTSNTNYYTEIGNDIVAIHTPNGGVEMTSGSLEFVRYGSSKFYLNGNNGEVNAGTMWTNGTLVTSDRRLKDNIEDTSINGIETLNKIKVRSFDWKENGKHENIGFIAQELEEVDPTFVSKRETRENEELKDYQYYVNQTPIIALLVKTVQEQQKQIEELKSSFFNEESDK